MAAQYGRYRERDDRYASQGYSRSYRRSGGQYTSSTRHGERRTADYDGRYRGGYSAGYNAGYAAGYPKTTRGSRDTRAAGYSYSGYGYSGGYSRGSRGAYSSYDSVTYGDASRGGYDYGRARRGGGGDRGRGARAYGGGVRDRRTQSGRVVTDRADKFDYSASNWKEKIKKPKVDTRHKTEDVTNTRGSKFEEFGLKKQLLRGIFESGFVTPSPIQEAAIPEILQKENLLARAKNGTGKTGAYSIPVLERVNASVSRIQAVILVPTRELALQTAAVVTKLAKYCRLKVVCCTGGSSLRDDILRFRTQTIHVVVGTPGRVLDLAEHSRNKLDSCKMVVCDEADKLLSPDFVKLVEDILKFTAKDNRQLMLFSATFPQTVKSFCTKYLSDSKKVNLMDELTLKGVTQYYAYVDEKQKVHCLYSLFKKLKIDQCIIFCKSVNRVELLARKISKLGFSCLYTHSKMSQNDRSRVFHDFRDNRKRFLVCTDLITRGIDIKSVNVVINFDFPKTDETYLHRIGRAGRFGHLALAINFITEQDRLNLYALERALGTQIEPVPTKIDEALYTV